jgi:photosystem II stability/assembly factor-like uncharacterized protein
MRRSPILLITSMWLAVLTAGSATASTASTTFTAAPRAVPSGFHAQSMSWVSPQHGWMLGLAPCGQSTCTTIVETTDAGATWTLAGRLRAPLTLEQASGVTEIRYADDLHGWAFEPALWATTDGGATWQRQVLPGGGHLALALAGDADGVYAVISPCKLNRLCHQPATLWKTTPGQGSWTQMSVALPALTGFNTTILAVHGLVAYLDVPAALIESAPGVTPADVLDVTVDGQTWSTRPDPCSPADGETLTGLAPISDTAVALLCQGNIGFGKAMKRVFRSDDTGQTIHSAGTMSIWGITTQLAAAPDGTLAASSYSIGSWIYRNAGGTTWTTSADLGDGGMGWNDIVFTTDEVGYVIHGPAGSPCCTQVGELWQTQDGGATWAPTA